MQNSLVDMISHSMHNIHAVWYHIIQTFDWSIKIYYNKIVYALSDIIQPLHNMYTILYYILLYILCKGCLIRLYNNNNINYITFFSSDGDTAYSDCMYEAVFFCVCPWDPAQLMSWLPGPTSDRQFSVIISIAMIALHINVEYDDFKFGSNLFIGIKFGTMHWCMDPILMQFLVDLCLNSHRISDTLHCTVQHCTLPKVSGVQEFGCKLCHCTVLYSRAME